MAFIVFRKDTGEPVNITHAIDVKDALATGKYTLEPKGEVAGRDVDIKRVRKAPDPVEPAEKKKPERRPEDKIIYKDAKTIGAPPKSR